MKSKIAFLLYDSRSGSTFLSSKIELLENCFVTNESDFVSRILYNKDNINESTVEFLFGDIRFIDIQIQKEELISFIKLEKPNAKQLIEYILLTHLKKRYDFFEDSSENLIVIKHTPIGFFDEIRKLWSSVRFLFIVRDGRDIHLSKYNSIDLYNKRFSENAFSSAINWHSKIKLFLNVCNQHDIIRYEEIIKLSDDDLYIKLANFLEVSSKLSDIKSFPLPKNQNKFHSNVKSKTLSNNSNKYEVNSYINFVYMLFFRRYLRLFNYPIYSISKTFRLKHIFTLCFEILNLIFTTSKNIIIYLLKDRYSLFYKMKKLIK